MAFGTKNAARPVVAKSLRDKDLRKDNENDGT